jgi:hypothetical protein
MITMDAIRHTIRRSSVIWICVVLLCCSLSQPGAGDTASRASIVDLHSRATLYFLTALTGDALARIAAGHLLKLADLPTDSSSQILSGTRLVCAPAMYDARIGEQNPADYAVTLVSDFKVTISGGGLQVGRKITIPLESYAPVIDPVRVDRVSSDIPVVPDPPSLDSILQAAPSDPVQRADFLRIRALAILDPVGAYRLTNAGIPIVLSRFTSPSPAKLSALDDPEKAWLRKTYNQFCLRALEVGQKVRLTQSNGTVVMEGVPEQWLRTAPPTWSDLGDVTVEYSVQYMPMVIPADRSRARGAGWGLPKDGVQ